MERTRGYKSCAYHILEPLLILDLQEFLLVLVFLGTPEVLVDPHVLHLLCPPENNQETLSKFPLCLCQLCISRE